MICGIDEAGRGPLAGPVCAAAVVLPPDFPVDMLADSKKLKSKQREAIRSVITEKAIAWGVGWASHTEIDALNILQASLLAMQRAFFYLLAPLSNSGLWPEPLESATAFGKPFIPLSLPRGLNAVVDGLHTPALTVPCTPIVKADDSVHEVMAASILAKTARDQLMVHYDSLYPQYGYKRHKGYPTKKHRELIMQHGPSPIQRKTFTVKM